MAIDGPFGATSGTSKKKIETKSTLWTRFWGLIMLFSAHLLEVLVPWPQTTTFYLNPAEIYRYIFGCEIIRLEHELAKTKRIAKKKKGMVRFNRNENYSSFKKIDVFSNHKR